MQTNVNYEINYQIDDGSIKANNTQIKIAEIGATSKEDVLVDIGFNFFKGCLYPIIAIVVGAILFFINPILGVVSALAILAGWGNSINSGKYNIKKKLYGVFCHTPSGKFLVGRYESEENANLAISNINSLMKSR